jgi:phosphoribosylaminoimidazole-succinocarboxamide synthase
VRQDQLDALAIAIGTSHGAYKFTRKPTGDILAIDRIKEIHKPHPQHPPGDARLVERAAGAAGEDHPQVRRPDEGDLRRAGGGDPGGIKHGVRKINIDTDIRLAMTAAVRKFLAENPRQVRPARLPQAGARGRQGRSASSATIEFGCEGQEVAGRSMLVKRLQPIPVEAVVRGYLAGSGWSEYQGSGSVCGVALPPGLKNASRLPEPVYTPAAKAALGEHDENISYEQTEQMIGPELARKIRDISLALYKEAAAIALAKGLIIADTKFEFGLDPAGNLILMDEVLTPDSSRYWPVEGYEEALRSGANPPSYDKQFVRDWLEQVRINGKPWDKTPPAPRLPQEVVEKTARKYRDALERLTA